MLIEEMTVDEIMTELMNRCTLVAAYRLPDETDAVFQWSGARPGSIYESMALSELLHEEIICGTYREEDGGDSGLVRE